MAWPVTAAKKAGKGIASLFKPKGKPDLVTSSATKLRNAQSAKIIQRANMTRKHYSDAFNKARARINNMKMSPTQKDKTVENLRTFYRNQHSEEMMRVANLGDLARQAPVTPVPDLVKQGLAFALGGGAGYGVAKNEEAITEMLKSTRLPTGIDVDFGMTSIGDLMGGGTGKDFSILGNKGFAGRDMSEVAGALLDQDDLFPTEYDEPDLEPGLEEGSIGDLLFFNRMFGD